MNRKISATVGAVVRAPEIDRPDIQWLNTSNVLSLKALRGGLVLLDFWTSGCINCLHAIPSLQKLSQEFSGNLTIIGIHSPKFARERDLAQVSEAAKRYNITHPLIHDPNRRLWDEYAIRAWPTLVLISTTGQIIGQYPGEPDTKTLRTIIAQQLPKPPDVEMLSSPESVSEAVDILHVRQFNYPAKIKAGCAEPNVWALTDTGHHQVVTLNSNGDEVMRYGSGLSGLKDGSCQSARFNGPEGLCCSESAIFIADTRNHSIRYIEILTGRVITLAGTGERGPSLTTHWSKGTEVALASPWDIELIEDRLYFANAGTHQIGEFRLSDGSVRLAAGSGREGIHDGKAERATLAQPSGLAYDGKKQVLYFVDCETSSLRSFDLNTRWVETLIGSGLFVFGDEVGSFEKSKLQHPLGIALSGEQIYIADTYNGRIKVVDMEECAVSYLDDNHFDCQDSFYLPLIEPAGLAFSTSGKLMLVDTNNHRVVEYDLDAKKAITWSGGETSPPKDDHSLVE